jgi:hypothetical protein
MGDLLPERQCRLPHLALYGLDSVDTLSEPDRQPRGRGETDEVSGTERITAFVETVPKG